jgi:hypothetical protein
MAAPLSAALLQDRKAEISAYLDFLDLAVQTNVALTVLGHGGATLYPLSKDLTHTLKANTYLLLYAAVEATMTMALQDIHDVLTMQRPELDSLHDALFLHVLQRFRDTGNQIPLPAKPPGSALIVKHWLDEYAKQVNSKKGHPLFSGNLDSRKIIEIGEKYGFATQNNRAGMSDKSLFTAKNNRNDLTHGSTSFKDLGQSLAAPDLRRDAEALIACLENVVQAVAEYLAGQQYLAISPPVVPALPQSQV